MYGASWSETSSGRCSLHARFSKNGRRGLRDGSQEGASLTWRFHERDGHCSEPSHGFWCRLVPEFLWRWKSREEWKLQHRSTAKASRDKPHCLIQRDINLVGMGTLHPGWGTILCRRIGHCQDKCPNTPNKAPHLVPAKCLMRAMWEDTLFFSLVRWTLNIRLRSKVTPR